MFRRSRRSPISAVLALSAVGLLAACGDDNDLFGPGIAVNPAAAQAVLDSVVERFFTTNDALAGLHALGPFIIGITRQPDIVRYNLMRSGPPGSDVRARQAAQRNLRQSPSVTPPAGAGAATVPELLRGSTLIWDPVDETYVVDPNDDGAAPDLGIRFRLYTVDSETGFPATPLDDIGHVDIIDASSRTRVNLSLDAVVGAAKLLDFGVNGSIGSSEFDLRSAGFLSDGAARLNFSLDVTGTPSSIEPAFSLNLGSFRVDFRASGGDSGAGNTIVALTDLATDDVVELTLKVDSDGLISDDSHVTINGRTVAMFVGTVDEAFLARAEDSPLSTADLVAMGAIFNAIGEVFATFNDLFFFGILLTGHATPV